MESSKLGKYSATKNSLAIQSFIAKIERLAINVLSGIIIFQVPT
jgi:hypothetical protein